MIYLMAILIGFTTILSMAQNSSLSRKIGLINTSTLNYITGLSTSLIFFIGFGNLSDFSGLKGVNIFAYFGGILGLIVVLTSSYVLSHISIIVCSMLMYTGQMLASFAIDYFLGVKISPIKILGIVLVVTGIYVNNYIDYKYRGENTSKI